MVITCSFKHVHGRLICKVQYIQKISSSSEDSENVTVSKKINHIVDHNLHDFIAHCSLDGFHM